jgi:hypothetical protein
MDAWLYTIYFLFNMKSTKFYMIEVQNLVINMVKYEACFPILKVIENIDVHLSSSDHFRFCWYPHTDECIVFHSNRTGRVTY